MPFKIWLPWERQVTWTATCHFKLLPDKFWKKSPSLVTFALILKKVINAQSCRGQHLFVLIKSRQRPKHFSQPSITFMRSYKVTSTKSLGVYMLTGIYLGTFILTKCARKSPKLRHFLKINGRKNIYASVFIVVNLSQS